MASTGNCSFGNFEYADLAISAGDPVSAALELDVDFAGLEQEAGNLATLVDDVVSRLSDDGRGQLHRPAGMRAATCGNPGSVVGDVSDAWNALHARYTLHRINHEEAYSLGGEFEINTN